MAKNENVRLQAEILQADERTFLAVKAITDYSPANPAYSFATLAAKNEALHAAQEAELRAQNAFNAARDASVAIQRKQEETGDAPRFSGARIAFTTSTTQF
jgi:hypothetical protein